MISLKEMEKIDVEYKEKTGEYPPTFDFNEEQIEFVYEEAKKVLKGEREAIGFEEVIEEFGEYYKSAEY